jgi:hypothetical protein
LNLERNTSKVKGTCGEIKTTETADVDERARKEEEERPKESLKRRNLIEKSVVDTSLSIDYSTKAGSLDSFLLASNYFVKGTNGIRESIREELEGENSI